MRPCSGASRRPADAIRCARKVRRCSTASGSSGAALGEIRARADVTIDTTELVPRELRDQIRDRYFNESLARTLAITVSSFGFKYDLPADADIVMDVRFLPNPYYDPCAATIHRPRRAGPRVRARATPRPTAFLSRWLPLLETVVPGYIMEGKHHLAIALGLHGRHAPQRRTRRDDRGVPARAAATASP